ncbi:YxeA family protein [Sporosarcina sp. FSL K6-1508]|uniref:YxeA family protein n=1 Tax=Sporosarcina sp. FSL K6-1508 TaxID=2921553 RepID=UPI0030F68E0A
MKKVIVAIAIIVVIIGFLITFRTVGFNRLGTESYYVQITESGTKLEDKSPGGELYVRYEYTLPAFDKKGNEKEFTFTGGHELRKDAYLELFIKKGKEVTSYQEVEKEEIPTKAKDKLN